MGDEQFLVVGLGASAGGIHAFKRFFEHVPADSGIAYVVILHLSPEHESHLAEVLQVSCAIPVTQVVGRELVLPNHVYVVPPNRSLVMVDGHVDAAKIARAEDRRAPIDLFLRTLAETHGSRAVAVVLSGTGADGSMGMKHVKERGGICLAQDPDEAEHTDMPRHSIATGLVDCVLPAGEIPAKIMAYEENRVALRVPPEPHDRPAMDDGVLREVFTQLRLRTGHDFTHYKTGTVLRRIGRRMAVHELPDVPAYAQFLRNHPAESTALLKDLLISVTNFFRDPNAFATVERAVIPGLLNGKRTDEQVRVWVAGCATGEEAYSMAMLLAERAELMPGAPVPQIFATDIDADALTVARAGFYSTADTVDVPAQRLRRFFTREAGGFRVRKDLREMVLFANHNLIKDPPFSHLDMVSCRNLLIYLNRAAQQRVAELVHFALNPGGYLLLGSSEVLEGTSDLFIALDKDAHLYGSRAVAARLPLPLPERLIPAPLGATAQAERDVDARVQERLSYADLHQKLLERYAPPSLVVSGDHQIVHLSPRAGQYLQVPGGEPTHDLLRAIHPALRLEVRTALYQAAQDRTNVETGAITVAFPDGAKRINIVVKPELRDGDPARGFFLVLFEDVTAAAAAAGPSDEIRSVEPMAQHLEAELIRAKHSLRLSVEQYETQTEELKASNEELQAINEELRSSAEELETSKEELQSVNEELSTVNQELKIKIDEQTQSNNHIRNLINSTDIATIFLDRSYAIRLFTPRAAEVFQLIPSDVGRPLTDISSALLNADFHRDLEQVLDTLQPVSRDLMTRDGRWYTVRFIPYRTFEDRIDGVVLTFLEMTERRRLEESLIQSHNELESRVAQRTTELGKMNAVLESEVRERRAAEERAKNLMRRLVGVQEDERRRIARDLHDHLGQQMTALRLHLDDIKQRAGGDEELRTRIARAEDVASRLDADVDFLAWELRPAALDDIGVTATLADFLRAWSKHYGVPAEFHTRRLQNMRLPPEIETNLYRVAQEALNNVYKHAAARSVSVILERRDGHVVLIVEDDGGGFDAAGPNAAISGEWQLGLMGMRERAALVGGTLEIESAPGKGTTVFIRVPLDASAD